MHNKLIFNILQVLQTLNKKLSLNFIKQQKHDAAFLR